ncbi:hypothetical protein RBB50_011485 [Rhinocladiella similis]
MSQFVSLSLGLISSSFGEFSKICSDMQANKIPETYIELVRIVLGKKEIVLHETAKSQRQTASNVSELATKLPRPNIGSEPGKRPLKQSKVSDKIDIHLLEGMSDQITSRGKHSGIDEL